MAQGLQTAIQSFFLEGPAGRLEAVLNQGTDNARFSALICHPHPLYGGNMHNKVVFHTMKALNSFGFPVLRFNFRGAGLSEGVHDYGQGEQEDVRTAVDWLSREFAHPVIFAGFSFGAVIGLRACCADERVPAMISVGTPTKTDEHGHDYSFLESCAKPKLFISGSNDKYAPQEQLKTLVARLPGRNRLVILEGADHFLNTKLDELQDTIQAWVREMLKDL